MDSNKHLVFVYGTLLKGQGNGRMLEDSELIGVGQTEKHFTMHCNGAFPAITEEESYHVQGEVYQVTEDTLEHLDMLEGYRLGRVNNLYERKLITVQLESGRRVNAWVYYQKRLSGRMERCSHGDFRAIIKQYREHYV